MNLRPRFLPPKKIPARQRVAPDPGPASPEHFSPDSGLVPPGRWVTLDQDPTWRRERSVSQVAVQSPGVFNPDPGAPPVTGLAPLFEIDRLQLAPFGSESIPPGLSLPRTNLVRYDWRPWEEPLPVPYESGPLPEGLRLPRRAVRENIRRDPHWNSGPYPLAAGGVGYPSNAEAVPNRWNIRFVPWRRYDRRSETPYVRDSPSWWHPYRQSILKGDVPIAGQDIFLNLTAGVETEFELRRLPTPSGVSSANPGSAEFFGRGEQWLVNNNLSFTVDLFKGETAFKPVEWAVHLQPVFNVNYVNVRETGQLSPDPRGLGSHPNDPPPDNSGVNNPGDVGGFLGGNLGGGFLSSRYFERRREDFALQEAFVELHLGDLSTLYDFWAMRAGTQPFVSDFRGFIFNDVNLGARVFGTHGNNRRQWNLAAFAMREKDTYSGLNTFNDRDQRVLVANWYLQDLMTPGYTAEFSFHVNLDDGLLYYDRTGALARPAPLGTIQPHSVQAYYFGWAGEGHAGPWNLSHAFYQVFGDDTLNGLAGRPVNINAQMAALEISLDRDWIRYKGSIFYASGDGEPEDGRATGFDSIVDRPTFVGGPFSYYARQGFNLAGTSVALKQRDSLLPSLRTSKTEGQANFVNPGVFLLGLGAEMELTPKLRHFLNLNYIWLVEPAALKTALLAERIRRDIGIDGSVGFLYRPLLTDQVVFSAGVGVLLPGGGYRDVFQASSSPVPGYGSRRSDDVLYSAIVAITFTY